MRSQALNVFSSAFAAAKKILRSTRPMNLNEWAETHGHLSAESSADVGRWKSIPYQVEMMNAISDESIEGVVIMKSARVGYTKILDHACGYFIEHKPSPILVVQPTVEDAEGFSKEELAPYIRDVECLRELVSDAKAKDGTNSILHKLFPGGVLSIIGANSPRGFRRISRRIILLDEVSGYPKSAGPEGSPVKLAIRRSEYFWDRKIVAGSTPNLAGECQITSLFEETDQRRYFVNCPHCGHSQYFKFKNLKWPDDDPMAAYFECESEKKCRIEHKDKRRLVEGGHWIATAQTKRPRWVGFHIWAAYSYSPNSTWGHIASEFLQAKREGREAIQTFVNTVLGEPFDDTFFEKNNITELRARAEAFSLGGLQERTLFCTAGVDVQDNRLAIEVMGWGEDDEAWFIDFREFFGNPGDSKVWQEIDKFLDAPVIHPKYGEIKIKAVAVDSGGHFTHEVYQFTRERRARNFIAIKGASQRNKPAISKPSAQDINFRGKTIKKGAQLYQLGVDTIKSVIYSRLKILEPGAKYMHFSVDLNEDFYKQLQSERKVVKLHRGQKVIEWVRTGRNEALDCGVYAFAAKELVLSKYPRKLAYSLIRKELELSAETKAGKVKAGAKRKPAQKGGGFVDTW